MANKLQLKQINSLGVLLSSHNFQPHSLTQPSDNEDLRVFLLRTSTIREKSERDSKNERKKRKHWHGGNENKHSCIPKRKSAMRINTEHVTEWESLFNFGGKTKGWNILLYANWWHLKHRSCSANRKVLNSTMQTAYRHIIWHDHSSHISTLRRHTMMPFTWRALALTFAGTKVFRKLFTLWPVFPLSRSALH